MASHRTRAAPADGTDTTTPTTPSTTVGGSTTTTTPGAAGTSEELLAEANQLFVDADAALKAGDLGAYQAKEAQARKLVQQAFDQLQPVTSVPSSSPATVTATSIASS